MTDVVPVREVLNIELPLILERRAGLVLRLEDGSIKHIEFRATMTRTCLIAKVFMVCY